MTYCFLSAQQLDFWNKNGYLVIENVLSPQELKSYQQECNRITLEYNSQETPFQYPHKVSDLFAMLMKSPTIIRTCENLIHDPLDALQTWMYFKPPGELGRDVHQNSFYTQVRSGKIINVWTALDDADEENGCLFVYPGSQVEPILPIEIDEDRVKTNPDKPGFRNERGKAPKVPSQYEIKYIPAKAGTSVFIHSHVLHGSEENRSIDRYRRAFLTGYISQNEGFRPGDGGYNRKRIPVY